MKKNLISIIFATLFAACTDYIQQIDDRYGEWETSIVEYSSSAKLQLSSTETSKFSSSREKSSSSVASSSSSAKSSSSAIQSAVDPSTVTEGTITDTRDSKIYKTVTIGTQTWMAENLNFETDNSYCWNDSAEYCSKYGRLYLWSAAMDSAGIWSSNGSGCGCRGDHCSPTYPVRGVCPRGWHLPTGTEFQTLVSVVGGQSIAGKMLKSTEGWYNSGNGTDAFFFSALPAGYRTNLGSYFYTMYHSADFWTSSKGGSTCNVRNMHLDHDYEDASINNQFANSALSVRCIKD